MAVQEKKQDVKQDKEPVVVDPRQEKLPVDPPKADVPKVEDKPADTPVVKEPSMIAKLLHEQGVSLYRDRSGYPLSQAQRNLEGKSHYAEDVSLRDYSGKILSCVAMDDGLTLGIVESYQAWPGKTEAPLFRPVYFDVFGNVTYRPDPDNSKKSLKEAQADFWRHSSTIDPVEATIKGLESKRQAVKQELDKVQALMDTLTK